jgi:hypothetical protein
MSIPSIHGLSLLRLLVPIAALVVTLPAISCVGLGHNDDVNERFYGYFLRDAKAMQEMGLPVYWLGRQFTATPGGLTFRGPYGAEFGGEVEGGGVSVEYITEGPNRLDITIYSPHAWELAKDRILNPQLMSNEGEVTRRTVTVKGRQAELISVPSANRPVNALSLILELDTVVVLGEAHSLLSADGASELNIFINNPDLLVQVMQDLRPYPE